MSWRDVPETEQAELGTSYRTSIPLAEWAFPIVNVQGVQAAVAIGKKISGDRIQVTHLEIFGPGGIPEDWVARGYRKRDWGVRVTWKKIAGGTPVAVYAAAIVAVITAATIAWVVIAKFTEKEFVEFNEQLREDTDKLGQLLKDTLFNPGVIISALAAIALLSMRRK